LPKTKQATAKHYKNNASNCCCLKNGLLFFNTGNWLLTSWGKYYFAHLTTSTNKNTMGMAIFLAKRPKFLFVILP
jgi:hypothetical protein